MRQPGIPYYDPARGWVTQDARGQVHACAVPEEPPVEEERPRLPQPPPGVEFHQTLRGARDRDLADWKEQGQTP